MRRTLSTCLIAAVCAAPLPAAAAGPGAAAPPDDSAPDDIVSDVVVSDTVPDDPGTGGDVGTVTGGDDTAPPATLPLLPVPVGCEAPPLPHVVFVGEVVARDFRTVRFEIGRVRFGQPAPFAADDRIDVRYGLDAQYLHDGERYLVSALVDPDLGLLVSRVTPPIEDFGGDEVIGVSETDVNCPGVEDPMRTLNLDGTPVDAPLLAPLAGSGMRIAAAFLVPLGAAVAVIFLLAMLRLSVSGLYQSVRS